MRSIAWVVLPEHPVPVVAHVGQVVAAMASLMEGSIKSRNKEKPDRFMARSKLLTVPPDCDEL